MKILIVDDNAKVRVLIRDFLPDVADEIYECSDGEQAIQLYEQHRPDWVLMDQEMPRMDGISAVRKIITEFPEAQICMVTAFDDDDLRLAAISAGAAGFVIKDNLFELEALMGETR